MPTETTIDCPALHQRSDSYPFGDRVPRTVRMLKTVTADPMPGIGLAYIKGDAPVAKEGLIYPVWTNSHGAVTAVMEGGTRLGLRPAEFEVDSWHGLAAEPAPQPHPEPIAWMVGTAFWWTKEEAERDAAATGLPIVGLGPMTSAAPAEQHHGDAIGTLVRDYNERIVFTPIGDPHIIDDMKVYAHADPGDAERLRGIIRMHEKTVREQTDHLAYMRAQLAERDALLHSLDCAWNSHDGKERFGKLMRKVETLAASAEPCAAVEVDHDALVAAVCVLRSQGLGNLSAAVEEARTALERKPS